MLQFAKESAGILLEEKRIVVVKSNQAHRASFDPIVARTYNLNTPGTSTVDYLSLPYRRLPRPMYPIDPDMEWQVQAAAYPAKRSRISAMCLIPWM
jgi:microcystin degradation protein MlrC